MTIGCAWGDIYPGPRGMLRSQVGSGKNKGKQFFPHIVVDFDLAAAMGAGLVKSLALDKRSDVAALPLDFKAERDEQKQVTGLSHGQRVMLRAGLRKLQILEDSFRQTDQDKHPKLLIVCEETSVTGHVVEFLRAEGLSDEDVLAVDSNRKGEMSRGDWEVTRERLFDVDRHPSPRVIVSVLMLREGFDVNNICVIVPLRSSSAQILLEQTIGRGLRLMWRGDERVDELKDETRSRFRQGLEPTNFFDVLFIVEHPAFSAFYDELLAAGLAGELGEHADSTNATGDLIAVELREGYEQFDFGIPLVIRDVEEELIEPRLDPMKLPRSRYPLDMLKSMVGKGDKFISEDAQTKTQYGDYRVHGGVMTATGYNDFLSRMTTRISEALGSSITPSAKSYSEAAKFPLIQTFRPQLTGWIDAYIRRRMFDTPLNPLDDENWRVLLIDDVAHGLAGTFATALTEVAMNQTVEGGEVGHRWLSEVAALSARSTSVVEVNKCIYPMLPVPTRSGGLERKFSEWADRDAKVVAFSKIDEYRHDFLHRPYLKADGMPAYYSPDFIVRAEGLIFVVETKSQSALSDTNVQRKQKAAVAWVEQLNQVEPSLRGDCEWHYVLLGEGTFEEWRSKNASLIDLLNFARLRRSEQPHQESLL